MMNFTQNKCKATKGTTGDQGHNCHCTDCQTHQGKKHPLLPANIDEKIEKHLSIHEMYHKAESKSQAPPKNP